MKKICHTNLALCASIIILASCLTNLATAEVKTIRVVNWANPAIQVAGFTISPTLFNSDAQYGTEGSCFEWDPTATSPLVVTRNIF